MADYGGNAVKRKLRGINIRVPSFNITKNYQKELPDYGTKGLDFAGNILNIQSTRILSTLEDTAKQIDTKNINLESGIDDVIASVDKKLTPDMK